MKHTKIIKIWGGPGIGKTTTALRLTAELSIMVGSGKSVEYVGEYAKQLIWRNQADVLRHQPTVTKGQIKMLAPVGQCDYVITDSPLEMGLLYSAKGHYCETKDLIDAYAKNPLCSEMNILLVRDRKDFQKEGRVHTFDESVELDRKIQAMLEREKVPHIKVSNTVSPSDLCRIILQDHA